MSVISTRRDIIMKIGCIIIKRSRLFATFWGIFKKNETIPSKTVIENFITSC